MLLLWLMAPSAGTGGRLEALWEIVPGPIAVPDTELYEPTSCGVMTPKYATFPQN